MLTILDEYTREALSVTIANKMGSSEVLEALYPLLLKRGKPEYLRSDNRPEFSSELFTDWLTPPRPRNAAASPLNHLSKTPTHWCIKGARQSAHLLTIMSRT